MIYDDYIEYTNEYVQKYGEKTIIFMEVGGFYEIYGVNNEYEISGANMEEISSLLNIQVSRKNKNIIENSRTNPLMAGFPSHSVKKFIDILINNNYTIVFVEQTTPPPKVIRKVTNILSPSTYIDNLTSYMENKLMVIYIDKQQDWKTKKQIYILGISVIDISTAKLSCQEIILEDYLLSEEVLRIVLCNNPKELVIISTCDVDIDININNLKCYHNKTGKLENKFLELNYQKEVLKRVYTSTGLMKVIEYVNLEKKQNILVSFVYLLQFIYSHNENMIKHLGKPDIINNENNVILSGDSIKQLNVIGIKNSLCDILNSCCTSMGKRKFVHNLCNPITNIEELKKNYENIDLYKTNKKYIQIRNILKHIVDIQRIINSTQLHPHLFVNLYSSMEKINEIFSILNIENNQISLYLSEIIEKLDLNISMKYNLNSINENIFLNGINYELDKLGSEISDIENYFNKIQNDLSSYVKLEYSDKDGISLISTPKKYKELLKNTENKYKLEIANSTKNNVKLFNEEINKNNVKYITYKSLIKEKTIIEYENYVKYILEKYEQLFDFSINTIENLDVTTCNAYNADKYSYNKPVIKQSEESFVDFKNLRHPIIERIQTDCEYIPNSMIFHKENCGQILYGINSSGKSSFMKSVGLSLIMAQAGMYVPAESMIYYPYNSIFTRITNNDDIYKGQSTFVVEMLEMRTILNLCDKNSLVIGDELCSGTESISAISLVSSGIIQLSQRNCSFIFATHLHELSKINEIKELSNVKINHLNVIYDEKTNKIIYDRKLKEGPGNTLYGLEVCKSLDLNEEFLRKANCIRQQLLNIPTNIVENKTSIYNTKVIVNECGVCNKMADDVHHIKFQNQSNENKMIEHHHMNAKFNLVPLCKTCHDNVHSNKLNINGYIQTSNGIELQYDINDKKTDNMKNIDVIYRNIKQLHNDKKTQKEIIKNIEQTYDISYSLYKLRKVLKQI
jgi:DNA mismatch repair protein MutS